MGLPATTAKAILDQPHPESTPEHAVTGRDGKLRYYFRRGEKHWPIPGKPGQKAFSDEYQRLLDEQGPKLGTAVSRREPGEPRTMSWVITQYEASDEFKNTAASTKEVYGRIFDWLR